MTLREVMLDFNGGTLPELRSITADQLGNAPIGGYVLPDIIHEQTNTDLLSGERSHGYCEQIAWVSPPFEPFPHNWKPPVVRPDGNWITIADNFVAYPKENAQ